MDDVWDVAIDGEIKSAGEAIEWLIDEVGELSERIKKLEEK